MCVAEETAKDEKAIVKGRKSMLLTTKKEKKKKEAAFYYLYYYELHTPSSFHGGYIACRLRNKSQQALQDDFAKYFRYGRVCVCVCVCFKSSQARSTAGFSQSEGSWHFFFKEALSLSDED